MKKYTDKEWLQNKLIVEEMTYVEVSKLCGVSDETIRYHASKFGLRSVKAWSDDVIKFNKCITEAELRHLRNEGVYVKDIAKIYKVSTATVLNKLHEFGLVNEPRPKSVINASEILTEEFLSNECKFHTVKELSEITGLAVSTVRKYLNKYKLKAKNGHIGVNHWEVKVVHGKVGDT